MSKKDDPILPPEEDPILPPGKTPTDMDILPESNSNSVSVDTDSRLTPISKEEIKQVDSSNWQDLSATQLFEQLEILELRKSYCQRHNVLMVDQIDQGIKLIHELLRQKTNDEIKLL